MSQEEKFRFNLSALLPIAALCAMAISHPLYDLLVREDHATFFVAHESKSIDIYFLVFILSAALPLILYIALWMFSLLSKNLSRTLYALVIFVLFSALFIPASQKLFGNLGWGNVGLGVGSAIVCTILFATTSWARTLLSIAAIGALISPAMFLTNPAMSSFLATPEAQDYKMELLGKKYPNIVMIVFDEFPLISLLDENRQIDDVRFPNFARLAKTSTWYRNTITAHTTTTQAVPSLLTGRYVNIHQPIASSANYPESIVSFLSSTHQLRGVEIVTKFFDQPENQTTTPTFGFGLKKMGIDILIVLGHLVLPGMAAEWLPAIDSKWSDFQPASPGLKSKPAGNSRSVKEFVRLLRTTPRSTPAFFYLHLLLPHSPLRFNDDGRSIGNELYKYGLGTRSPKPNTFANNEQDSLLIYQAHLLQTRFVDLILGQILSELESLELFSDSLIIITSDHGIGYVWYEEEDISDIVAMRAGEVYWVPFFLKKPNQEQGEIIDAPVVTVDIFPTVAEILGKPIPWAVDGLSAIGPERKRENRLGTGNPDTRATWLPAGKTSFKALEKKIALFGQHNLKDLYFFGPYKDLIGRRVDTFPLTADKLSSSNVTIKSQTQNESTKVNMPFYLKGELTTVNPKFQTGGLNLAISINGIIRGTTRTTIKDNRVTFMTRISPESWESGENSISVYAIFEDENDEGISLAHFREADAK
ncbi:sulfatase-like hydrolase/transferase [Pseudomonadota bacterium]